MASIMSKIPAVDKVEFKPLPSKRWMKGASIARVGKHIYILPKRGSGSVIYTTDKSLHGPYAIWEVHKVYAVEALNTLGLVSDEDLQAAQKRSKKFHNQQSAEYSLTYDKKRLESLGVKLTKAQVKKLLKVKDTGTV